MSDREWVVWLCVNGIICAGIAGAGLVGCCYPTTVGPLPVIVEFPELEPPVVEIDIFPSPGERAPTPEEILHPVVRVRTWAGGSCTGFVAAVGVDFAFVVTAFHCLDLEPGTRGSNEWELPRWVQYYGSDEQETPWGLVGLDVEQDLAVFSVGLPRDVSVVPAKLGLSGPRPLETFISVGIFGSLGAVPFTGLVGNEVETGLQELSGYVFRGMSGGPVYHLEGDEWRVFGLTSLAPFQGPQDWDAGISLARLTFDFLTETIGR